MSEDSIGQRNKNLVVRLIDDLFYTSPPRFEVIDEVVHEDYLQHNPEAGQGREGLRTFVQRTMVEATADSLKLLQSERIAINLIAEDDLVVRQEIRKDWMLIDIFRCRDGMLVEHWDALRSNPALGPIPGF